MYNKQVRQNEDKVKRLINCVVFLPQRAHFRGHSGGDVSNNRGSYLQLIFLLSECNKDLYYSLSNNKVFALFWRMAQNLQWHNYNCCWCSRRRNDGKMKPRRHDVLLLRWIDLLIPVICRAVCYAGMTVRLSKRSLRTSQGAGGQKIAQPWPLNFWRT